MNIGKLKEYEGLYEIDSFGNIFSLNYNRKGIVKALKQLSEKWRDSDMFLISN